MDRLLDGVGIGSEYSQLVGQQSEVSRIAPSPSHPWSSSRLRRNPDGSLDIYLQHAPPAGHESNWLPAPEGTFEVTLRLYGPRRSALGGTYVYPEIVTTG